MKLTDPVRGPMDFESCRFDFRIDSKNGLTPSKRKKTERKCVNNFTLFKCKVCGCLFDSRPALLEHKISHNKFKCVFCEARFSRQTWMMDHVALVHGMGETAADADVDERAAIVQRQASTKRAAATDSEAASSSASSEIDSDCSSQSASALGGRDVDADVDAEPRSAAPSPAAGRRAAVPTGLPPPPPPLLLPQPLPLPPLPRLDASPRSPNLLPLLPTHGLPISPPPAAATGQRPVGIHPDLPNPQHFTPPPPQLPPPPPPMPPAVTNSTTSATPPHLLQPPPASVTTVPCFYINVPILISSGSCSVNGAPALSSSSSPSSSPPVATTTTTTSCSVRSPTGTATPLTSLLPVNPFPRKDLPPKPVNSIFPSQLQQQPPPSPLLCLRYPEAGFGEVGKIMDLPQTANVANVFDGQNASGLLSTAKPSTIVLNDAEDAGQTEALDFSLKSDGARSRTDDGGGKPVFSLGIRDPSETLRSGDLHCEGAVDLTIRPSPDAIGEQRVNDDKVVMQQEYPDQTKADPDGGRDGGRSSSEAPRTFAKEARSGTKRRSSFLDKMVQKLWQSKISRWEEPAEGSEPLTTDVQIKAEKPERAPDESNTSLGRVYVLNEMPEQIDAYAPGFGLPTSSVDLSVKKEAEAKEGSCVPMEGMSDGLLRSTAASIAGSVMADVPLRKNEDRGFCAIKFHTCRVCKQLFYSAEEMWEHAVTHEDFHKYKCNQCAYVTACHRELVNHKLVNHGLDMQKHGRHICTHAGCMRSYSDWRHLKEHQKVHEHQDSAKACAPKGLSESLIGSPTKDGRLMCDFAGCYKTFKEWRHLKVHQTLHTGEKPLSCQLCSYACRHRSSMNWHMKSKHGLDKMKTQGNRTVYVDGNRRVVCGWSDEANREVNYLKEMQNEQGSGPAVASYARKAPKRDRDGLSDYSAFDDSMPLNGSSSSPLGGASVTAADGSSGASVGSSRPPSCAPSDNPSERSLMDAPHTMMLKMQNKPSEFPLNMSVQIEDLSPKEQMVGADGQIATKATDDSERLSERLTIDVSPERDYGSANGTNSPSYETSTVSSSVSSCETPSAVTSEGRTLVMTPVAMANLGQGSDHQASMMKFKLKYLVAPKFFPCKVCNENFDSATKMWEHRIREHKQVTQFYCDSCSFFTDKMNELQGHMLSTHGKEMGGLKDHVCFICGKGYATRTGLNQHLLRHSEEGPPHYECPYENCASKVHSKCALKNHIRRVHLKVPAKYQCPEDGCRRRFDSSSALRNHQILHTEHRPLVCNFNGCDKSFRESKHLKVHRMQHTDEKPIKCELCDYSCRQRNSMNWHMKSKHNCEKSVSADGRTVYVPIKS